MDRPLRLAWLRNGCRGNLQGIGNSVSHSYGRLNNCFPTRLIKVVPTAAEIRDRAVWVIEHENQGTAFFLKDVGLVTAAHCVKDVDEVEVFHPSKHTNTFKATVRKRDEHRDLAILDHTIPENEYFELDPTSRTIAASNPMTAIGYPGWGYGDSLSIRPGVVSALPVRHGVQLIEVTQMLSQGMSGGPLLDAKDEVAGIIQKGGPRQERNLAIHINVLEDWLNEG